MKLKEAVKNLEELNPLFETWLHKDFEKAHKLGIEALKSIQKDRVGTFTVLLPGETKE